MGEDARDILHTAAEHMDILLRDPSHFLHEEPSADQPHKIPLVQQKKEMLAQLLGNSHSPRPQLAALSQWSAMYFTQTTPSREELAH